MCTANKYEYKKVEGFDQKKFVENGHIMLEENVLLRLKRLAHLEEQLKPWQMEHIQRASNSALIDYIENDTEIAIPIDDFFNDDGSHITKKQYGKILIKYLVKELRNRYC